MNGAIQIVWQNLFQFLGN